MPRMPVARSKKRSHGAINTAPEGSNPLDLSSVPDAWIALVNISRQEVQARGQGHIVIMSPGHLDGPTTGPESRFCIRELDCKAALNMFHNNKATLKPFPLSQGRKLRRLAQAYKGQGRQDAFFVALARMFPQFAGRNEVDEAYAKRELITARKKFKSKFGYIPAETMSVIAIQAAMKDDLVGASMELGKESIELFEHEEADADVDAFIAAAEADAERAKANLLTRRPKAERTEPEPEEEAEEEVESPESLEARVQAQGPDERVELRTQLAKYGITKIKGQPSAETLRAMLAKAVAGSRQTA